MIDHPPLHRPPFEYISIAPYFGVVELPDGTGRGFCFATVIDALFEAFKWPTHGDDMNNLDHSAPIRRSVIDARGVLIYGVIDRPLDGRPTLALTREVLDLMERIGCNPFEVMELSVYYLADRIERGEVAR